MLTIREMGNLTEMPEWADISLQLYKDFTINYLLPKTFRYYFVNGNIIDIEFKEWAMGHIWALQHIKRINKKILFRKIDEGLDFTNIATSREIRKRLFSNRDRVRMFACIVYILKEGSIFFVDNGKLKDTSIKINYLKSKVISKKGVNLGIRLEEGVYVPLTLLIDTAVDPCKTVRGLTQLPVARLEIIEDNTIKEVIHYSYVKNLRNINNIHKIDMRPKCFDKNSYTNKLIAIKIKNKKR